MDFNKASILGTFIEELKCSVCNNYLSYFPIYVTTDDQNICGRCEVPKEVTCSRNKVYEIIANEIRFPCRYINDGCVEKLLAWAIPKHEDQCVLRFVKCPVAQFDLCANEVRFCDVAKHCQLMHQDLILRDGQFEIDLSKSQSTKNILIETDQIFLFETKFECEGTKLNYRLFATQKEEEELPKRYELSLGNDPNRNLVIVGDVDIDSENSDYSDVSLNVLKIFKDHSIGKGSLDINNENNDSELEALNIFKCPECSTYNRPPFKIKNEKYFCQSCNYNYISTTISDQLCSKLPHCCKNQKSGCTLTFQPMYLPGHELYCQYGTISCPIAEFTKCEWTGLRQDLTGHITENHFDEIATSTIFDETLANWRLELLEFTKFYIIKMSNHFFLLRFVAKQQKYYWYVELIGESEESGDNFHYELRIGTDPHYHYVIKNKCRSLTNETPIDQKNMHGCHLCSDQLPEVVRTLHFEILIHK